MPAGHRRSATPPRQVVWRPAGPARSTSPDREEVRSCWWPSTAKGRAFHACASPCRTQAATRFSDALKGAGASRPGCTAALQLSPTKACLGCSVRPPTGAAESGGVQHQSCWQTGQGCTLSLTLPQLQQVRESPTSHDLSDGPAAGARLRGGGRPAWNLRKLGSAAAGTPERRGVMIRRGAC